MTLYTHPAIVALGPFWSAIVCGFAYVDWTGTVRLSWLGAAYLAEIQ